MMQTSASSFRCSTRRQLPKLAVLVLLGGCAGRTQQLSLEPPAHAPSAGEYAHQLKRWTRYGQLEHELNSALQVGATFLAPEFRAAFAEKYIDLYRIPPTEAPRIRNELVSAGADRWEFYLEVAAHRFEMGNLNSERAGWRVSLLDDQQREITTKDIHLLAGRRAYREAFYPYVTDFSQGFSVRFPRNLPDGSPLVTPSTKVLTLRLAGPEGSVDLVWRLGAR